MEDRILFVLMALIVPLITAIAGIWMRFFTPTSRYIGYRTPLSEKNAATWEFANQYCGLGLIVCALALIVPSLLVMLLVPDTRKQAEIVLSVLGAVQAIALTFPAVATEIALHRRFDQNGNPK